MTKKIKKDAVVVTTKNRGVFFGYVVDNKKSPAEITLEQVRMCVYWDTATKGVLGLSATGPTSGCRITHAIPQAKLYEVTGIFKCSPEATENWEKSVWK